MKTMKKLWAKVTSRAKTTFERFQEIIRERITRDSKGTPWLYIAALALGAVAAGVTFYYLPGVVPAFLARVLPFTGQPLALVTFFAYTLPVFSFLHDVYTKALCAVFARDFVARVTPLKDLRAYPKELVATFNWLLTLAAAAGFAGVVVVVNVINKLAWLVEQLIMLPIEFFKTGGVEGFKTNMQAWVISWKPSMFLEDSLGSVIAKQFRMDGQATKRPSPAKMRPVTVPNPT